MKASWKKVFIARYVLYLEVFGFILMGAVIAGIVSCFLIRTDDPNPVKTNPQTQKVTELIEKITLPAGAYVKEVLIEDGDVVEEGDPLFEIVTNVDDLDLLNARQELRGVLESLESVSDGDLATSESIRSVRDSLATLEAQPLSGETEFFRAPIGGIIKENAIAKSAERAELLGKIAGTVPSGAVCELHNFETLRFTVNISGKNAGRVRINRLAREDIKDWRGLTAKLLNEKPASGIVEKTGDFFDGLFGWKRDVGELSPAVLHVRELLLKMWKEEKIAQMKWIKTVRPNKKPADPDMNAIIGGLEVLLHRDDLYDEEAWEGIDIGDEARGLYEKRESEGLGDTEKVRFNRLVLESILADEIKISKNERQPVKTKIIVQREPIIEDGVEREQKPLIYKLEGKVYSEPVNAGLAVSQVLEFYDPPEELRQYLKDVMEDPSLETPQMTGNIVVDRIRAFRYLFVKK